jgi:hypothetical protein
MSGIVRSAFTDRGHYALSCDLQPTEIEGPHHLGDVRDVLDLGWDLLIGFPPCTHLAVSGAKHFHRKEKEQKEALAFFRLLWEADIPRICIENPVGIASTRICKPTQIIQPWQFGDPHQKTTCLWLKWLPRLVPTNIVDKGEFYVSPSGKRLPRWYSNYGGGCGKQRSFTFPGIAAAMADQWGNF